MTRSSVTITHPIGLHARTAMRLVTLAQSFSADVEMATDENGPWIDAKSITEVILSEAVQGTTLHLRANGGTDAAEAVRALVELVQRDFDMQEAL